MLSHLILFISHDKIIMHPQILQDIFLTRQATKQIETGFESFFDLPSNSLQVEITETGFLIHNSDFSIRITYYFSQSEEYEEFDYLSCGQITCPMSKLSKLRFDKLASINYL